MEDSLVALEGLADPSGCTDDDGLARAFALPPADVATDVQRLRGRLADAAAATLLDEDAVALRGIVELAAEADRIGHDPLTAEILLARGRVEREIGSIDAARETLASAAHLAAGAKVDRIAAQAWLQLLFVEGYDAMDPEAATALLPVVDAALARVGNPDDLLESRAASLFAMYTRLGRTDDAERYLEERRRLADAIMDPDSLQYVQVLESHAAHAVGKRDFDGARESFEQARTRIRDKLGADTPREADLLTNLAVVELHASNMAVAAERAQQALAIYEARLEPDDERIAWVHGTLGTALIFDDRPEQALFHLQAARQQRLAHYPPDHPVLLDAHYQLALALSELGRVDEAAEIIAPACTGGSNVPPHVAAPVLLECGRIAARRGHFEHALAHCTRSLNVAEAAERPPSIRAATRCIEAAREGRVEDQFAE